MSYERATEMMNTTHQQDLVAIAQAFGSEADATAARIVALDDAGMDLDIEVADGATRQTRVPFNPSTTPDQIRERMVELSRQAHTALGKS